MTRSYVSVFFLLPYFTNVYGVYVETQNGSIAAYAAFRLGTRSMDRVPLRMDPAIHSLGGGEGLMGKLQFVRGYAL